METINKYVNWLLLIMLALAPFAIVTGCEKQERMEIARAAQ